MIIKYKKPIIAIIVIFVLLTIYVLTFSFSNDVPTQQETQIYRRSESWGPCPEEAMPCNLDISLYDSGKLVVINNTKREYQISQNDVANVKKQIELSGVFEKNCTGPIIMDYSVEYELNINGRIKTISVKETGCMEDFNKVNKIIDSYFQAERKGGA